MLVLIAAWVLFVPTADWLAHHDVGSVKGSLLLTARDAARGRLLTLGAGLFAAGALVFTARNFALSREGQVADRYAKAIDQLGSEKLDVRIGGIYALERLARASASDHPTVMEVLAAFIREHSREERPAPEPDISPERAHPFPRPDVQSALTVIGRRDISRDRQQIDLTAAVLPGALLFGADLTRARLVGTDLRGAVIHTDAKLTGANLTNADLTGADLTGAHLHQAKLTHADLTRAQLTRADLTGADLDGADLTRANLTSANLTSADFTRANLMHADLINADLTGARLAQAKLAHANLMNVNLTQANLLDTDLTQAFLANANLTGATFTDANLTGALWPRESPSPGGWVKDPATGLLKHAAEDGDEAGN